ncbi:MAG: hypothetical protein ABIN61_06575 [candidate division WOR-3 bacterium]
MLNQIRPKFGIICFLAENSKESLSFGFTHLPEARKSVVIEGDTLEPNVFPLKVGIGMKSKTDSISFFPTLNILKIRKKRTLWIEKISISE